MTLNDGSESASSSRRPSEGRPGRPVPGALRGRPRARLALLVGHGKEGPRWALSGWRKARHPVGVGGTHVWAAVSWTMHTPVPSPNQLCSGTSHSATQSIPTQGRGGEWWLGTRGGLGAHAGATCIRLHCTVTEGKGPMCFPLAVPHSL